MAKYKPQHARLQYIDRMIREKRYPSCAELAEGWEVSERTIQRDLDYLRYELDAPLAYSPKHRGFHYTEEQYQLPAIHLRESDLFAVYLAEMLLNQYEGTPIHASLCSVFRKIEDSLPDKIAARPETDQSRFTVFPPHSTVILPEVLVTVFDCLRTSTRLEIEYRNPGGQTASRQVDPYHGVRFEGDWYLVGLCHLRCAIRTFSLARMTAARKGREQFAIPPDFDFRRLSGSHFGVHWGREDIEVRIRFTREAAVFVRERRWHPSQQIEEQADGSLVLTLIVNHLLELRRWILSWGEGATVLAPASLASENAAMAQRIATHYGEGNGGNGAEE